MVSRGSFTVAGAFAVCLAWPAMARAATDITGGEVGGQVWTPAGSPYVITGANGAVSVAAGSELRIDPGTVVLIAPGWSTVSLAVSGKLTVNGTAAAPVTFQAMEGGTAVTWRGIAVSAGGIVRITGAVIRNASWGVQAASFGGTQNADIRIDRTTFENCRYGVSSSRATTTLDAVVLRNNLVGVEAYLYGSVTVTNALIQGNTSHGLIAVGPVAVTIVNATIDGNASGVSPWFTPVGGGNEVVDIRN